MSWWRDVTRRDHASAARQVRTAIRLGNLEELSAALDAAAVTLAHCEAVTNACVPGRAAAIAAAEGTLTTLARTATPRELRVACRRIADLVDPDGSTPAFDPGPADEPDAPDEDAVDPAALTGEQPGVIGDPERGVWLQPSGAATRSGATTPSPGCWPPPRGWRTCPPARGPGRGCW